MRLPTIPPGHRDRVPTVEEILPPRTRRGSTLSRVFGTLPSQIPDVPHSPTSGWLARLTRAL